MYMVLSSNNQTAVWKLTCLLTKGHYWQKCMHFSPWSPPESYVLHFKFCCMKRVVNIEVCDKKFHHGQLFINDDPFFNFDSNLSITSPNHREQLSCNVNTLIVFIDLTYFWGFSVYFGSGLEVVRSCLLTVWIFLELPVILSADLIYVLIQPLHLLK